MGGCWEELAILAILPFFLSFQQILPPNLTYNQHFHNLDHPIGVGILVQQLKDTCTSCQSAYV